MLVRERLSYKRSEGSCLRFFLRSFYLRFYRNTGFPELPAQPGHIAVENRTGKARFHGTLHIGRRVIDEVRKPPGFSWYSPPAAETTTRRSWA